MNCPEIFEQKNSSVLMLNQAFNDDSGSWWWWINIIGRICVFKYFIEKRNNIVKVHFYLV